MALKSNPFLSSSDSFKFRRFVPPDPAAASAVRGGTCRFPKFVMASTLGSGTTIIDARVKSSSRSKIGQRINILAHLKPAEKCWQPHDFLPDPASHGFEEQVRELQERAKEIPDDYFVVLVGRHDHRRSTPYLSDNALTPRMEFEMKQEQVQHLGPSGTGRGRQKRTDMVTSSTKYLYLSGRVDMRQIETIQYLIGSGMDPRTENSPYLGFIYTSFQERATFISHGSTARHAKEHGNLKLAQICGTIASDEKRHEMAYTKIVEKLFEIDPNGTVLAFTDMMRKKISMPAHLMYDGSDDNLFENFSAVAQRLGVFTAKDYADILEFLVGRWKVESLAGLSGEGRKAQEYVCGLPPRIRMLEERSAMRAKEGPKVPFSRIFDREIQL